jgi:hypothetical protein
VFGDRDGARDEVRLQHPLGLAFGDGALWVADTYNSKLKRIDPHTGETKTVFGDGGHASLFEPSGLAWDSDSLWIADTNHHQLVSLRPGKESPRAWIPSDLHAPVRSVPGAAIAATPSGSPGPALPVVRLGPVAVHDRHPGQLEFAWELPAGTGINDDAPYKLEWLSADGLQGLPGNAAGKGKEIRAGLSVPIPAPTGPHPTARGKLYLVLCDIATHRVCVPYRSQVEVSFQPDASATHPVVTWKLPSALQP